MPEGHTIHRLARDLSKDLVGRVVSVASPQGRLATDRVDGSRVEMVDAVGKHLFLRFSEGSLHVHLGLFGRFRKTRATEPTRPSVRLRLVSGAIAWELSGPTICAWIGEEEIADIVARLGPDPLSQTADPTRAWKVIHTSKRAIGALLLDQEVIAGIGNVYRAEILHLVGVHPELPGNELPSATYRKLWRITKALLERGVEEKRIRTVDDVVHEGARRGTLHVYGRRDCRRCGTLVGRLKVAQREIHFCPSCQPKRSGPRRARLDRS